MISFQGLTIKTLLVIHDTYVASQCERVVTEQNRKNQMIGPDVCLKVKSPVGQQTGFHLLFI